MINELLNPTGLYLESIENFSLGKPINSYYGFNVSCILQEPIDQIQAFIAAKRIQEHNLFKFGSTGLFILFIAGIFEVLNQSSQEKAEKLLDKNGEKETKKQELFERIIEAYGIQGKVHLTTDLWKCEGYWTEFASLFEMRLFSREGLIQDTLRFVGKETIDGCIKVSELPESVMSLPPSLREEIGGWPATIIYTPAEVAEAAFFAKNCTTNLKIGPAAERMYDKYIAAFMDIVHLRQPVDLRSQRFSPKTACPYIEKGGKKAKLRIFFDDTASSVRSKLEQITSEQYVFTVDEEAGIILNPIVEKLVYAVESARALGKSPVSIGHATFQDGKDVSNYILTGGSVERLKTALPEIAEQYLIEPFR